LTVKGHNARRRMIRMSVAQARSMARPGAGASDARGEPLPQVVQFSLMRDLLGEPERPPDNEWSGVTSTAALAMFCLGLAMWVLVIAWIASRFLHLVLAL
jgi:hypothetical protein